MAYTKITWVNGETPLNATNLNRMEDGISEAVIDPAVLAVAVSMGWTDPGSGKVSSLIGFILGKMQTIHISTSDPTSGDGKNGDVWLKYSEE